MSNIIGMLRVQNESRWIDRVIRSIQPVCSEIHVFDDASKDETPDICRALGATVYPTPYNDFNESRDKNYLLGKVIERQPDWILHIDGDEELTADGPGYIRALVEIPDALCFSFRIVYLWDRIDQVRIDGGYGEFYRESLFRPVEGEWFPERTGAGGNMHCGNAPRRIRKGCRRAPVDLLHYGYLHHADRVRKFHWYSKERDPNNRAEDGYRHMVIGDVFPATSHFAHGGPLRFTSLDQFLGARS